MARFADSQQSPYSLGVMAYLLGGPLLSNFYAKTKSNELQRDYLNYQKQGYERQLSDWKNNVPNRQIRYPELSYPGRIRSADIGISQSYYNDIVNASSFQRSVGFATGGGYRSSRSLYGKSAGRSSRYL